MNFSIASWVQFQVQIHANMQGKQSETLSIFFAQISDTPANDGNAPPMTILMAPMSAGFPSPITITGDSPVTMTFIR